MKAGWEIKKLGEVCEFVNRGVSPKYLDEGGICVLNQKCVRNHSVNFELARRHDDRAKSVSEQRLLRRGDVLVNSTGTGTLGRVAQIREDLLEPTTVDSHVTIARPKTGLFYSEFFGYAMVAIEEAIKEAGEGCGGQTELSRSVLAEKFSIQYPKSLSEQAHIVGILDEAFASIATAKANTQKNLENAKAVFESHLNSVFSKRGEGWVEKKLGDVCDTQYGLSSPMNSEAIGYKCFRMGELQNGQLIDTGKMKYAEIEHDEFTKYRLEDGDVLFNRTNSYELVGKTGIFTLKGDYCFASYLIRVKANRDLVIPSFLNHLMNSSRFQTSVKEKASKSVNQANINATILSNEILYIPLDLKVQREISAKVEHLKEETSRLTSLYTQKLAALEDLKKSLLHQAFTGKL